MTASTAGGAATALVCFGASVVAPLALLCALAPGELAEALTRARGAVVRRLPSMLATLPALALAWAARTLRGLA